MADNIDVVIRFDTQGNAQLRQAGRSLDGISASLADASRHGERSNKVLNKLTRDLNREFRSLDRTINRTLDRMGRGFDKVISYATRLGLVLGGIALFAVRDFTRSIRGVADEFFRINEQFQGLEISISSVFRSRLVAQEVSKQIETITARSPIPLEDLTNTARGLGVLPQLKQPILEEAAAGKLQSEENFLNQAVRLVEQLVAFRPDKNAADAVFAIREALSGEFRSLIRRFDIPIQIVTSAAGKSLTELKQDPLGTLEALQKAFDNIVSDEAVANLVRLPSKLFENLIEQIFSIPLKKIGDAGAFKDIQDRLVTLFEEGQFFSSRSLEPLAKKFSNTLTDLIDNISGVLERNIDTLLNVFGAGESDNPGLSKIERVYQGLFNAFDALAQKLPEFVDKILQLSRVIIPFLTKFTAGLFNLATVVARSFESSPLGTVATAFAGYGLYRTSRNAAGSFIQNALQGSTQDAINSQIPLSGNRRDSFGAGFGSGVRGGFSNFGSAILPFGGLFGGQSRAQEVQTAVRERIDQLYRQNSAGRLVLRKGFADTITDRERELLQLKPTAGAGQITNQAALRRLQTATNAAGIAGFGSVGAASTAGARAVAFGSAVGRFVGGIASFGAIIAIFAGAVKLFNLIAEKEAQQDLDGRTEILKNSTPKFEQIETQLVDFGERQRVLKNLLEFNNVSASDERVGFFRSLEEKTGALSDIRIPIEAEKLAEFRRENGAGISRAQRLQIQREAQAEAQDILNRQQEVGAFARSDLKPETFDEFIKNTRRIVDDVNNLESFLEGNLKKFTAVSVDGAKPITDAEKGSKGYEQAVELLDKLQEDLQVRTDYFAIFANKLKEKFGLGDVDFTKLFGTNEAFRNQSSELLGEASSLNSLPDTLNNDLARSFGLANIQAENVRSKEISTDFRETEKFVLDLQKKQDPYRDLIRGSEILDDSLKEIVETRQTLLKAYNDAFKDGEDGLSEADKIQKRALDSIRGLRGLAPNLPAFDEKSIPSQEDIQNIISTPEGRGRLFIPNAEDPAVLTRVAGNIANLYSKGEDQLLAVEQALEYLTQQLQGSASQRFLESIQAFSYAFSAKLVPDLEGAKTPAEFSQSFDAYFKQVSDFATALGSSEADKLGADPIILERARSNVSEMLQFLRGIEENLDPSAVGFDRDLQKGRLADASEQIQERVTRLAEDFVQLFPDDAVIAQLDFKQIFKNLASYSGFLSQRSKEIADSIDQQLDLRARQSATASASELFQSFGGLNTRFDSEAIERLSQGYAQFSEIFNSDTGRSLPSIDFSAIGDSDFSILDQLNSAKEMQRVLPEITRALKDEAEASRALALERSILAKAGGENAEANRLQAESGYETAESYDIMAENIERLLVQYSRLIDQIEASDGAIKSFLRGAKDELEGYYAEMGNLTELGQGFVTDFSSGAGNALGNFVTGVQSADEAWRSFIANLAQSQANKFATKLIEQVLGLGFNYISGLGSTDLTGGISTQNGVGVDYAGEISKERGGLIYSYARGGLSTYPMGGLLPYEMPGGGYVDGPSHEEGGVKARTRSGRMLELEGGEAIINKRSTRLYRKELSEINAAGGGVRFETGGVSGPSRSDYPSGGVSMAPITISTPIVVNIDGNGNATTQQGQSSDGPSEETQAAAYGRQLKAAVNAQINDGLRHDGQIYQVIKQVAGKR